MVLISISPTTATVNAGGSQTFTATVSGSSNTAVTYSTSGGTITVGGVYTAPATAGSYHVVATSQADPTKTATATVTVQVVSISISPTTATITLGGSQTFTATVSGSTNTAVTYSVTEASGGTITAGGTYTAPATAGIYHVVATSQADATKTATATVTVKVPGFNDAVYTIAPAGDGTGDLYVGGIFTAYGDTRSNSIIRLNSNGTVDTAFAVGTGVNDLDLVRVITPAGDGTGDVYVGGDFTSYNGTGSNYIIRLNSNGTVDPAFAVGTGFNIGYVIAITPAGDGTGDIYVGGFFTSYNGTTSNRIIRLNSNGTVDSAFAIGTGFDDVVIAITPAGDGTGDLYVGGAFTTYNGTTSNAIIRLNSNGTVDTAFAVGTGFNIQVRAITPAGDGTGDVYVGGDFTSYNGTGSNYIIRLNSDGTVDTAFAVGTGFNEIVIAVTLAEDGTGDLYLGGVFTSYNGTASNDIIRLNSNGTVDAAFAVGTGFNSAVRTIVPAGDGTGDLYVGGFFTSYDGTGSNFIIQLNSNGMVDTAFAVVAGFNRDVYALALAVDGTGDLYAGGFFTSYNGTESSSIIRLNSNGTVDAAFAVGAGFNDFVEAIAPAGDGTGDLYVGGGFTSYNGTASNRIIRLNSNGTVDAAFAVGTGFDSHVRVIAPAGDGSGDLYVGGFFTTYNGTTSSRIIRLNSNGTVDTAFAVGTGFNGTVIRITPAGDGSGDLYVGGAFTSYNGTTSNRIIRLNSNGTVETAFAVGTGFNGFVRAITLAGDGSGDLYVGGGFTSYNGTGSNFIIRLNSNGTVETAFAVGTGFGDSVLEIEPAGDGSGDLYVGGFFTSYNGTGSNYIIRLNSNGTVDAAFAVGVGFNDYVEAIAPTGEGTGDIYVGGVFTLYDTTVVDRIVRLGPTGILK